jgi:hypothetical protein
MRNGRSIFFFSQLASGRRSFEDRYAPSLSPTNHVACSCDTVSGHDIPQATSGGGSSRRNHLYCTVLDASARYRRCAVPLGGRGDSDRLHRDNRISRYHSRIGTRVRFLGVLDLLKVAKHGRGQNIYLIRFHYVRPRTKKTARRKPVKI